MSDALGADIRELAGQIEEVRTAQSQPCLEGSANGRLKTLLDSCGLLERSVVRCAELLCSK